MKNEPLCHAPCPIARSLGRIGDSWSIMILRDAFAGFTRFDEFQKSSNVAPNILSRRLKALVDDGLLEKVCYSSTPPRYGEEIVKTLPNGRLFVLRGQGHSVIGAGCMPKLFAQFIEKADAKALDPKCLDQLGSVPPFTSFNGWEP